MKEETRGNETRGKKRVTRTTTVTDKPQTTSYTYLYKPTSHTCSISYLYFSSAVPLLIPLNLETKNDDQVSEGVYDLRGESRFEGRQRNPLHPLTPSATPNVIPYPSTPTSASPLLTPSTPLTPSPVDSTAASPAR